MSIYNFESGKKKEKRRKDLCTTRSTAPMFPEMPRGSMGLRHAHTEVG